MNTVTVSVWLVVVLSILTGMGGLACVVLWHLISNYDFGGNGGDEGDEEDDADWWKRQDKDDNRRGTPPDRRN